MSDRDILDYQEWVDDTTAIRREASKFASKKGANKMKFLIKNKNGPEDELPKDIEASFREAKSHLTAAQTDRFYRATKVWFVPTSRTFEFEDTHV